MRLGVVLGVLLCTGGCASEREDRQKELNQLYLERDGIQRTLDSQLPGSRWSDHRDTDALINRREAINRRISEL